MESPKERSKSNISRDNIQWLCTKDKQYQKSFKNLLTQRQILKFLHLSLFFCLFTIYSFLCLCIYNMYLLILFIYKLLDISQQNWWKVIRKWNCFQKKIFFLKYNLHTIIFILLNYTIKSFKANSKCLTFFIINYRTLSLLLIFLPLSLWQALIYFLSLKIYSFWIFPISEKIKCTIFCAWQFSVSIMFSRFIHVVVCINSTTFSCSWRLFYCMMYNIYLYNWFGLWQLMCKFLCRYIFIFSQNIPRNKVSALMPFEFYVIFMCQK